MGMYSSFDHEDIKVVDWKGLKDYLEAFQKLDLDKIEGGGWNEWFKEAIKDGLDLKEKEFSFNYWDNIKLISYWYPSYLVFLSGIAPYIDGEVHWTFENPDEAGYVKFEDGECKITTGNMNWSEWKPEKEIKNMNKPNKLSKEIKKFLMLSKISNRRRK